jgi:5-formyltetrahydrofolate cyclo-ligase
MTGKEIGQAKARLREQIRRRRRTLDPAWVREASRVLQARLFEAPVFRQSRVVFAYLSLPEEVATALVLRRCWEEDKTVCVPAFDAASRRYEFARLERGTPCGAGPAGVPQPREPEWVPAGGADLVLVPGVAFDARGGRVGHGGGHYDRLLSRAEGREEGATAGSGKPCHKMGLAFEFQIFDRVPTDERDVSMDSVLTEERLLP